MKEPTKVNIVFLNHTSKIGGAERSHLLLLKNIDTVKFNPSIILPEKGPLSEKTEEIGLTSLILPLPFNRQDCYKLIKNFKIPPLANFVSFMINMKIHIVHANSWRAIHWAFLIAKLSKAKLVCHVRDLNIQHIKITRVLLNQCDQVIAISNAVRRNLINIGINSKKISVVYNAVDIREFDATISGRQVRKDFGIGEDDFVISMFSQLVEYKGHRYFIEAAVELKQVFPNIYFLIVGGTTFPNDEYENRLRQMIKEYDLEQRCFFTGFRDDVPQLMAASDIIVVPTSDFGGEPFGRVIIEAMAMKKPVVATNAGGAPEIIVDNITGKSVPMKDSSAIAKAVAEIINNDVLYKRFSENGYERVKSFFSAEQHVHKIEEIYSRLMS